MSVTSYDFVIAFFLIAVGAFLIEVVIRWKHVTHRKLAVAVTAVLAVCWFLVFYGSFVEPRFLTTKSYAVALDRAATHSFTAAVIGDFEVGPYKGEAWVREVVDRTNAQHPDAVFLMGDYVADNPALASELQPLQELHAPLGVFAVLGNHEGGHGDAEAVANALTSFGVTVLRNETTRLSVNGTRIILAGVDDMDTTGDPQATLDGLSADDRVILLAHTPDVLLSPDAQLADLVLAGHTHGGQIRLPFIGPVLPIPDKLGNRYDMGTFTYQSTPLFITPGVGESGPRARLFDPPEISLLTIEF